jgi:hypothetical protein
MQLPALGFLVELLLHETGKAYPAEIALLPGNYFLKLQAFETPVQFFNR